jgi:hypothetical protein
VASLLATLLHFACAAEAQSERSDRSAQPLLRFGGCGGVYFLVEPGDFWVEVEKSDLNKTNRKTFLRAILVGPDRSVIRDEYLPDDMRGKGTEPGPVQRIRLSTHVTEKGVYGLNITVTEDRYGEDIAWGFRTNCRRYLVETSRGHRDAPHEEPLVLLSPDAPGEVCFMPESRAFSIDISGFPSNKESPTVHDAVGRQIATMEPDEKGSAHCTIPANVPREAVPWRLRLPAFQATVQIDGVTRWPQGSDFPDFSLWTPQAESWFPLHTNRWLLTPYSQTVYTESEAKGSAKFEVHNNALVRRTFNLSIEFPDQPWTVELSAREVTVPAGETAPVSVAYTVPDDGDARKCHVRVTPQDTPEFSTYATLLLHRGVPPAARPLAIPLVLKPYNHENEQFGYQPQYPLTNQVYFDGSGRPFISSETGVFRWHDNVWTETCETLQPDGQAAPFRPLSSKVAFDKDNGVYLIGEVKRSAALLYSRDEGATFRACVIPGPGSFDIEQFSGHNTPDGPPPLVRYTLTEKDPKLIWRRLNDLDLLLPEKGAEGVISIQEPAPISKKCIGFSAHSGIPSSVVSRGGKVHVAWAEATDPKEEVAGVPTFVATYDRTTKKLGQPALVGYGPPANDVHNTPCITIDSQGYLHVLVGTHGRAFKYARSLQPNDAGGGWTEAEDIGSGLKQTYVGLVCGENDVLHLVFRLFSDDRAYFPAGNYAMLAYMTKRPGEPWSQPQPLVVAPFSEYSVFYHRLTLDRAGRLFLSYDYWSTFWFYRTDHWGTRRALMMSSDAGKRWQLASMDHLSR